MAAQEAKPKLSNELGQPYLLIVAYLPKLQDSPACVEGLVGGVEISISLSTEMDHNVTNHNIDLQFSVLYNIEPQ